MYLAQEHNMATRVRIEPPISRSVVQGNSVCVQPGPKQEDRFSLKAAQIKINKIETRSVGLLFFGKYDKRGIIRWGVQHW